ncbi:hypothetical protein Emag_002567 [Eimeria magna]
MDDKFQPFTASVIFSDDFALSTTSNLLWYRARSSDAHWHASCCFLMEPLLSSEAASLSKSCEEVRDQQASPSVAPLECRHAVAGTHALHHLLTAIAYGRVTAVDLRKALAAKSRNHSTCATSSSTVASSCLSDRHAPSSHSAVYVHHSKTGQSEASSSSGLISSGWTCAERCSCRAARLPRPCLRLDNVIENLHRQCDKHGRRMVWAAASAGEVFCRPIKSFFARRAVCAFQRNLSSPHTHEFPLQNDFLGAEAAEAAEAESLVHAVVYDEQQLLRCLALLNFQPSHILHLCFWAASRTLLGQPDACGFHAPLFFRLLAAVFPVADAWGPSQTLTAQRIAIGDAAPAVDHSTAAAEYVHHILVIPFLLWWKSLLLGLSDRQEAISREEAARSRDGGKRTKRCADAAELQKKTRKKGRKGVAHGSHRGRRARLKMWQEVLHAIIEKKRETCENAFAEDAETAKASKTLCSLLFPPWKSSDRTANEQLDDWCMTLADGQLSGHPKESRFLRSLASLEHAREHLTLKCIFSGPAIKDLDSNVSGARLLTADLSTFSPRSPLEPRASGGEPAEGRVLHVPHDRTSSWISWVLHRHELLTASLVH